MADGMSVKKESWDQIFLASRVLWNEFDPIGVVGPNVQDEYDPYAGEAALLAAQYAHIDEFITGARNAVYQRMGLRTPITLADQFASQLHSELSSLAQSLTSMNELFN
jgi:hypothetical protein